MRNGLFLVLMASLLGGCGDDGLSMPGRYEMVLDTTDPTAVFVFDTHTGDVRRCSSVGDPSYSYRRAGMNGNDGFKANARTGMVCGDRSGAFYSSAKAVVVFPEGVDAVKGYFDNELARLMKEPGERRKQHLERLSLEDLEAMLDRSKEQDDEIRELIKQIKRKQEAEIQEKRIPVIEGF